MNFSNFYCSEFKYFYFYKMNTTERKKHWENVFKTKDTSKVSWHQPVPKTSLRLIDELNMAKTARIIEVGAGDSFLGDFLLEKGFSKITLLDISEEALNRVKNRLGEKAEQIIFKNADVVHFSEKSKYNLWHDRAVFHFLNDKSDVAKYVSNVSASLIPGGFLIVGTFSNNGPGSCSGLNVQQYTEEELTDTFNESFTKIKCFNKNHKTPSGSSQNFLFCVFRRNY